MFSLFTSEPNVESNKKIKKIPLRLRQSRLTHHHLIANEPAERRREAGEAAAL